MLGRHAFDSTPDVIAAAPPVLRVWHHIGWSAVDLFFVPSGFLIGRLLVREWLATGTVNVGRFLLRRGVRIYPPFYLLPGATLLAFATGRLHFTASAFAAEALFLQNYAGRAHRIWNHTWSLAVEEQFYLLLPLLLLAFGRMRLSRMRPLLLLAASVAALVLLFRVGTWVAIPFEQDTHFFPLHLRLDALMVGVALAAAHAAAPTALAWARRYRGSLLVAATALLAPIALFSEATAAMYTIGLSLFAVGWAALLLSVLHAQTGRPWLLPLAVVGQASYSIYLFHPLIRMIMDSELGPNVGVRWGDSWSTSPSVSPPAW